MTNNRPLLGFFVCVFFLLASSVSIAQETNGNATQGNYSTQLNPVSSNAQTPVQTRGLDFGMPNYSSADPEYVAEQKMTESMTTVYNWIALNTARFAEGCKTNRAGLTSEISTVIQQTQETSFVCQRFATEASDCNPELFCSRFSKGNLPLPPEAKFAMKRAGYNPDTIKVEDITQELIVKVCMATNDSEINNRKQMLESAKEQVRQQLPAFRQKCEQMKQQTGMPNIRLPEFNPFQQGPRVVVNSQQQGQPMPTGQQAGQIQQNVCNQTPPDCYPRPPPFCRDGAWVCPEGMQEQIQQQSQQPQAPQNLVTQNTVCPGQAPSCAPNGAPYCENGNWICPQPAPTPNPEPIPTPMPTPEPIPIPQAEPNQAEQTPAPEPTQTPAPSTEDSGTAQTAQKNPLIITINSFLTGFAGFETAGTADCGNSLCEPAFGENSENCSQDCMPETYNQGINYGMQGASTGNTGYGMPSTAQQGNAGNSGMGNAQRMPMQGPSPEMLCNMTDDEIIESYTSPMETGMPSQEEMEYNCRMESGRMLQEMNRYKMEIARCKADAALDCQAKQQALQNCNELKDNPEKISALVINNMCRRFSTTTAETAQNKLFEVANKWYETDPALANQLGDTAEKTIEDQKQLDALIYLFGNGDYGTKLVERAKKLKEVKERLQSNDINDPETISILESQINELETEGNKFNNPLDLTRLGYIFRSTK